ncbi:MAG TPA: RNA methyltransferase [Flavitalea sp.]|nr:RNA methyltransferase [Flavitalea sp.]
MLVKSKVKYIQSLSQKQFRDAENAFVAEGPKLFDELIASSSVMLKEVFASPSWIEKHRDLKSDIHQVSEQELEKISSLVNPNQVVAIFTKPKFNTPHHLKNSLTLLLDTIQDPGNLGTILRCADWFGVPLVVCSPECADAFASKVIQATMGSICRVEVLYTDLHEFIATNKAIPLYAATMDGKNITEMLPVNEGMLMIGNESKGVRDSLLSLAQHKVKIHGNGKAESLNAAVATGILLAMMTVE